MERGVNALGGLIWPYKNDSLRVEAKRQDRADESTGSAYGVRGFSRGRLLGGTVYTMSRKPDRS